ncbi:hypothetical protein K431DRAFT_285561 [Polychaeton citri CBS 116435]|uniref:Uncharacterized protein n=1 Tax=Polychaeton citri CBS 116435 TaxID=1314669 RepID=A0A9P4UNF8_9PEZI|nr:hypothetical protein K431DRAFT_285561 [Polychaeton citri CBS 116435]
MAQQFRIRHQHALLLAALFATPLVHAQLSDLPDLSTATQATALSSDSSTVESSTESTTAASTTAASTSESSAATTDSANSDSSSTPSASVSISTGASTTVTNLLTNAPTIAGAGIPPIGVPDTAGAPYMQKSTLPEGTVFIVVGAILAFFGACVLFWRALVAWSINRNVKRAALASVRGASEKSSGRGYNPAKGSSPYYDHNKGYATAGSNMSLDALTSAGKPVKPFKDSDMGRSSTPPPPASLFFSPTADARQSVIGLSRNNDYPGSRASSYLPAGYYSSPSAHAAGGEQRTTIGGSLAPYAQQRPTSTYSPPVSPNLPPSSHRVSHSAGVPRASSRDALRPPHSRESTTLAGSRPGSYMGLDSRNSYVQRSASPGPGASDVYNSNSSPAINLSSSHLGVRGSGAATPEHGLAGSRAPSAYFEDLMENHGMGPRERF